MLSSAIAWLTSQWLIVIAIVGGVLSLIGMIGQMASRSKGWKAIFFYILIFTGGHSNHSIGNGNYDSPKRSRGRVTRKEQ